MNDKNEIKKEKSETNWNKRKNTVNKKRREKYNENKEEINRKRREKYNQEKIENQYNEWIYCIDIETSTIDNAINSKGEKVKCSYIISCCTSRININTGTLEHYKLDRTYTELNQTIESIYNSTEKNTLIYCHNFAYEWDFFKNNISFFRENTTKQMFLKTHKPLMIKCNHLQFRCSYLLTNLSVKTMGEKLTNLLKQDWKKLDYEYEKIRTPLTVLSEKEIEYNYRDTDIVCLYIYHKFIKVYGMDILFKKIYTITSTARYTAHKINKSAIKNDWYKFNRKCLAHSKLQLEFWNILFSGGLVTSNPNYFLQKLENVASFDFSSSYPYVMIANYFPYYFKEKNIDIDYFNLTLKDTKLNSSLFFNVIIKLKNFKINKLKYPIYSIHKSSDLINVVQINGKVVKADNITVYCTSLDFFMLSKFYDFEIEKIVYYEETKYVSKLPVYTLNTLNYLLEKKSEYKKYNNEVEHSTELKKYNFNDKELNELLNNQNDLQVQKYIMSDEYLTVKGLLNSQYGVNVQKPLQENVTYNHLTLEYEKNIDDFEKYVNQKRPSTNLIVGLYITAFARFNLLTVLYLMLKNNIPVYYTDTDSIKVDYSNKEKVDELISLYNQTVVKNDYKIGIMEFEGTYKYFVTNGNKSYITLNSKNQIKATMSGLPKATVIYQSLFDQYNNDFEKMINECYTYNTKLDYTVTKKLTTKYGDKDISNIELTDTSKELIRVKVGEYIDYVYTGTLLENCDLTIRDIEESKTQYITALVLNKVFNVPRGTFTKKHLITYDNKKDRYNVKFTGFINDKLIDNFIEND